MNVFMLEKNGPPPPPSHKPRGHKPSFCTNVLRDLSYTNACYRHIDYQTKYVHCIYNFMMYKSTCHPNFDCG